MRQLSTSTLNNQNISSYLLVHTYTADADRAIIARIHIDQVVGGGDYCAYATIQSAGAGSHYMEGGVTTFTVPASQTAVGFPSIMLPVNDTDVVKLYVKGLAADTATPDIVTQIFEDAEGALSNASASTSVAYATLAEFKLYASARGGTAATDANDDSVIEDILKTASRYIDGVTRRRFYQNTNDETRYYTPIADDILFIDDLAAAPTSIKTDTTYDRTYATTIASSDYDLEPSNALLDGQPYTRVDIAPLSPHYFPEFSRSVQIVGKFGFPFVPSDIKGACLGISLNVYQNRSGQSSAGNVSVTAAGVVIRPQDVPGWALQAINKYRRLI